MRRAKNNRRRYVAGILAVVCLIGSSVAVYGAEARRSQIAETVEAGMLKEQPVAEDLRRQNDAWREKLEKDAKRARKAEKAARMAEKARKAEAARLAERERVVNYALQFVGNPYVYGGTSLTNGADCSGFVQSVFRDCGYSLPRVASAQAGAGMQKSLEQMEVGDLLFYGYGGGITHVALYIGDGQIVHASTAATGIKVSPYNYDEPCMVASYLP